MTFGPLTRSWRLPGAMTLVGFTLALLGGQAAWAQFRPDTYIVDSFEDGVDGWVGETANTIYLNHAQSTTGATRGANSMLVDLYGTHQRNTENPAVGVTGWGVSRYVDNTDATGLYNAFNAVAADPSAWSIVFDVTLDGTSWADVTTPTGPPIATQGGWSFLNVGLNSDTTFSQVGPASANILNQQGKFSIQLPAEQFNWVPDSTAYQLFLGAQNRFLPQPGTTPGPPPAGTAAKYYIDNVRFKPKAPVIPTTLFSWETPDNPATPDVNEALENWSDAGLGAPESTNHSYAHVHRVEAIGATHGTKALTIDTSIQDPAYVNPTGGEHTYGFFWASNMTLNADTDPGDPEVIDPEIQARITDIATKINNATTIAFDVTFSDPLIDGEFPSVSLPTFLGFALHISDERGTFFQADSSTFDGATIANLTVADDPSEPRTVTLPISQFTDLGSSALGPLATAKLQADSTFLRIGLAVNADGPAVIRLDNFRVLTEIAIDADFDNNGLVNAADLAVWKSAFGLNDDGDANDDGVTDGADFLIWQRQMGNDATVGSTPLTAAVPEPSAAGMLACVLAALASRRRRPAAG